MRFNLLGRRGLHDLAIVSRRIKGSKAATKRLEGEMKMICGNCGHAITFDDNGKLIHCCKGMHDGNEHHDYTSGLQEMKISKCNCKKAIRYVGD
jgi:hypothetical protein